jgi:tetratricopeptide (TPR) repeat protein
MENLLKIMEVTWREAIEYYDHGHIEKAKAQFHDILSIHPDSFDVLEILGIIALQENNFKLAVEFFDRAVQISTQSVTVFYNRGTALFNLNQYHKAIQNYNQALFIDPYYVEALNNRGVSHFYLGCFNEALESYDQALIIDPNHAKTYYNRAITLCHLIRYDEALADYNQSIRLNPYSAEVFYNRGLLLANLMQHHQAIKNYQQAIDLKPNYAQAHWNESLSHLILGNFGLGWQKYEWRWKNTFFKDQLRQFTQPLWLGEENIAGKTILLYCEQGLGDTIQFCRYVKNVNNLGAKVILEVPCLLYNLLKELDGVSTLLKKGDAIPSLDYHCPLMSLPLALKTRVNNLDGSLYLVSNSLKREFWKSKWPQNNKLKIGLVWRGNPKHQNDINRSIPLDIIKNLIHEQFDFYSLQIHLTAIEKSLLSQMSIKYCDNSYFDFSDTAALVDSMDLVITVDTSTAHLAGALGKPTWILLPFNSDWRWLLNRYDSPWYHSVSLFRQLNKDAKWGELFIEVQNALLDIELHLN